MKTKKPNNSNKVITLPLKSPKRRRRKPHLDKSKRKLYKELWEYDEELVEYLNSPPAERKLPDKLPEELLKLSANPTTHQYPSRSRKSPIKLPRRLWDTDEETPADQRIKEALQGIGQIIREAIYNFFNTCFGQMILLCIVCALIAGFIILYLKLSGHL